MECEQCFHCPGHLDEPDVVLCTHFMISTVKTRYNELMRDNDYTFKSPHLKIMLKSNAHKEFLLRMYEFSGRLKHSLHQGSTVAGGEQ